MKRIMIICAHPDDAVIFCGGTILKEISRGSLVKIISLTGPNNEQEQKEIDYYAKETSADFLTLGYCSTSNIIDADVIQKLVSVISEFSPNTVITHWEKDTHDGHIKTYTLTRKSLMSHAISSNGEKPLNFYSFDTYWSQGYDRTIFSPSFYVDISALWEAKLEHISVFKNPWTEQWKEMASVCNVIHGKRSGTNHSEAFLKISNFCSLTGGELAENYLL